MECKYCGCLEADVRKRDDGEILCEDCYVSPEEREWVFADVDNYFIESALGGDR